GRGPRPGTSPQWSCPEVPLHAEHDRGFCVGFDSNPVRPFLCELSHKDTTSVDTDICVISVTHGRRNLRLQMVRFRGQLPDNARTTRWHFESAAKRGIGIVCDRRHSDRPISLPPCVPPARNTSGPLYAVRGVGTDGGGSSYFC